MAGYSPYSILGTETRRIRSNFVDQEYEISISLPVHSGRVPAKGCPVIYLLDANFFFGIVSEMTRIMAVCHEIPETLLVGIGYPWAEPVGDAYDLVSGLRCRDLTPVVNKRAEQEVLDSSPTLKHCESGGAGNFLKFIEMELVPAVENQFPVGASKRTLMGHSWGGTFCLYSLFQTDLFHQYLVCDPDSGFGDNALSRFAADYARIRDHLPTRLIFANTGQDALLEFLRQEDHPSLEIVHRITTGMRHCEGAAVHFQSALAALFG